MRPNAHIRMFFKSFTMACLVIGHVSCVDDEELSNVHNNKSDVVTFGINQSNKWQADIVGGSENVNSRTSITNVPNLNQSNRSEGVLMDYVSEEKLEEDIYIYVMEENVSIPQKSQMATSRGTEDSDHANFGVIAYIGTGETPATYNGTDVEVFMDKVGVDNEGNVIGNQYYWPGGNTWLKFFAYSPADVLFATNNENLYFPTIDYTVSENVNLQKDLMLGESGLRNGATTNSVEIDLKHLLSKIQVKVGNLGSNAVVTSIAFKGINSKGTYTYTKNDNSDEYVGIWTIDNTEAIEFKQPYDSEEIGDAESTDVGTTNAVLEIDKTTQIVGKPFYFLPQDLDQASIVITLEVTSLKTDGVERIHEYILSKSLAEISESWSPDKQYTYVITTPQEVEVEVSDNVVFENGYPVKKDFTITNTGLSSVFVRVAMVGSWVIDDDANGQLIVEDWKDSDGVFDWGEGGAPEEGKTNSRGWRKDENGFYYYMKPLNRGETAEPLFNTYTLTANVPMVDAYLNLTMAVQTVIYEDISTAWPEIVSIVEPIK